MISLILVRYGEMTLKKKNYRQFLQMINDNIKRKLKEFKKIKYFNTDYRFYIYLNGEDYKLVIDKLNMVSGLASYSLCSECANTYEAMGELGVKLVSEYKKGARASFKVETNRGDKNYPATSIEISQEVARRVLPKVEGLYVDVHNPEITLNIDLRSEGTYLYVETIKGLGGYPSGTAGCGLLMMSGGIDSPVAGFLSLKKGINLKAIHFASPPYTSDLALQKVVDLTEVLTNYSSNSKIDLIVIPFTKIQDSIHENASNIYMVTLMRRAMYKIASKICKDEGIDVIINGESIGQVASQTLESMKVVNEVTNIPIIRPLATFDKEEIVDIARRIKTFDISIRPYEDCCTVFVPEHPIIKPKLDLVLAEEAKCNLDDLIKEAIENKEIITLNDTKKYNVFEKDDEFNI